MITKEIEIIIKKEQERTYFSIPFEVPEDIEKMEISYSYEGNDQSSRKTEYEKNVIDLGLRDEKGDDIGTRGSSVKSVVISSTFATPGYKTVKPVKGTWQIIVGAYMIKTGGVKVNYRIDFYEKNYRWLKGDTHLHTNHSDGLYTRDALAKKCKKIGLDYMIFTDHNNNTEGTHLPQIDGLTTIRGVELTNYNGHINMWGLAKPFSGTFAINDNETILKTIEEAKANGAILTLCHPHCTNCPWLFSFDVPYDCIEVWNGPMRKDNLKTVKYWDGLLREGRRITAVGGSDYHRDYVVTNLLAEPTTHVYAESNDKDAVLDALKAGRVTISMKPNGTRIELICEGKTIGSVMKFREGQEVEIRLKNFKRGTILHVYDTEGEYFTQKATTSGDAVFTVPVRKKGFVRAEVTYEKKGLSRLLHRAVLYVMIKKEAFEDIPPFPLALSNPIYFE